MGSEAAPVSEAFVRDFAALFEGRHDAHGEGLGRRVDEEVTSSVYRDHLVGKRRIGIYCVAGATRDRVKFGAIDIDVDDWELSTLLALRLKHYGVPTQIERSKGKGWHVWFFFATWVEAWKVRAVADMAIRDLGDRLPGPLEVFPKQDSVPEGGYGNYINLPLFAPDTKGGRTCFYIPAADGKPEAIDAWEPAGVERMSESSLDELIDVTGLKQHTVAAPRSYEPSRSGTPLGKQYGSLLPCAVRMYNDGAAEGSRNEWTFRLAIHFKRNGYDRTETTQELRRWNERNRPPMATAEIDAAVASAFDPNHKNESLGCENPLIEPVCAHGECPVFRQSHPEPQSEQGHVDELLKSAKEKPREAIADALKSKSTLDALARLRLLDRAAYESVLQDLRGLSVMARDVASLKSAVAHRADQLEAEDAGSHGDGGQDDAAGDESDTIASQLIRITEGAGIDLFRDDRHEAYASFEVDGHVRTYRIRDQAFRRWLSKAFYEATRRVVSSTPLNDACNLLSARATLDGPCREVFVRIGSRDGAIYLDLGDDDWNVVEITRDSWKILAKSPIPFRRPPGLRRLPTPTRGGSIGDLRRFVNCTDEDWPLVLAWLVASFRHVGPFPILVILGEQGSAKSSLARVLKRLIDPNAADLRSQPSDGRDLMIAASNVWALVFDNLSSIPDWLSDAFCRLATGGGFATRSLFTNDEEAIFDAQRPLILNGIENVVGRSDLLDRSVVIDAPKIPRERRRAEKQFWAEFDEMRPGILGAILDAIAVGLKREAEVQVDSLPRMADFARWVCACEPALGLESGQFTAAYERSREAQVDIGVESCVAAQAVREFVEAGQVFEGTATALLDELTERLGDKTPSKTWPKSSRQLAGNLRRAAPDLRSLGIEVTFFRKPGNSRQRLIKIEKQSAGRGVPPAPWTPGKRATTEPVNDGMPLWDKARSVPRNCITCGSPDLVELQDGTFACADCPRGDAKQVAP